MTNYEKVKKLESQIEQLIGQSGLELSGSVDSRYYERLKKKVVNVHLKLVDTINNDSK